MLEDLTGDPAPFCRGAIGGLAALHALPWCGPVALPIGRAPPVSAGRRQSDPS